MRVIIIGAGFFGGVARDLLRREGIECLTVDARLPDAGSIPAGGLTQPSWLEGLGRDYRPGWDLLDSLYGLQKLVLHTQGKEQPGTIYRVPTEKMLQPPDILAKVVSVNPGAGSVLLDNGDRLDGVILATSGAWVKDVFPEHFASVKLKALKGVSFRFKGEVDGAVLANWAPYKHSVAFNIEPGIIWFGDGTTIKAENWSDDHVRRALKHAQELLPEILTAENLLETRTGLRPYVDGHKGYFARVGTQAWVSTGGAKNGLVLSALQALDFLAAVRSVD